MVTALVVSDEEDRGLRAGARPEGIDLIISAGDLPFDYLSELADRLDCPGVLVPGNHDPDLTAFRERRGIWWRDGLPASWPGPAGFDDADGRVVDVAGLRFVGLGGCVRYRPGPNQWSQGQQTRRAKAVARAAGRRTRRDGQGVDIVLTHAPPRGLGDGDDAPHHGFTCLHDLVAALRPRLLLHGHIHPYGQRMPDRMIGETRVVNVVGRRTMKL
jgi:hypothetical protein